jgi:hypothetical protein
MRLKELSIELRERLESMAQIWESVYSIDGPPSKNLPPSNLPPPHSQIEKTGEKGLRQGGDQEPDGH